MSGNDSEFESTSTRARKRMLPSVAEVARELSRRTAADAASILTTSRKVCAEELVRIKEGQESVPVEVLVERARALLEQNSQTAVATFAFEPPPPLPAAPSAPAAPLPEGADPFGETMGKLDLRWEGDAMESPHGHVHGHEVLPEPRPSPAPAPAPARIPFQPPPVRRSRLPFFLVIAVLAAAAGGAAWYFLSGPSKPAGPPPSLAVKRKPKAAPAEAAAPAAAQAAPTAPATPALPATPAWIKSGGVPPAPTGIPAQPTATKLPVVSVPPEPVPVELKAKSAPAAPSATQVQIRAGTLVTPDWTGAPVHVLHFSSFVEKARTEKHAAVLAKELDLPARAVQVDLGDKGIWYRAVVGEFATAEEALAFRNQLLEKGTPGVGLVYRMTPKK